jgi:hypothetical protein
MQHLHMRDTIMFTMSADVGWGSKREIYTSKITLKFAKMLHLQVLCARVRRFGRILGVASVSNVDGRRNKMGKWLDTSECLRYQCLHCQSKVNAFIATQK